MSKLILGHPYSGALYGYFSDQIGKDYSHTRTIGSHGYYTTLYGNNYKAYVDQAILFVLLYDQVWLTPADNHWPESKSNPEETSHHPELGLHADWDSYSNLFNDVGGEVNNYANDHIIHDILKNKFKIPESSWKMILSSVVYEANLSREHRCPVACSSGRKLLIDRIIEINRPAIHPSVLSEGSHFAIDGYISATSLSLSPTDLDHLILVKPESEVRSYSESFLGMLEGYKPESGVSHQLKVLELARDAIEKEKIGSLASGIFNWLGTIFRLSGLTPATLGAKAGSFASNALIDHSKWYELTGKIESAKSKALIVSQIETLQRDLSESKA